MSTFLVIGTILLHAGIPIDSFDELIYEDIIYPKNVLGSYIFVQADLPEDITLSDYECINGTIQLKEVPNGNPG